MPDPFTVEPNHTYYVRTGTRISTTTEWCGDHFDGLWFWWSF